jgi:hypothetical protein
MMPPFILPKKYLTFPPKKKSRLLIKLILAGVGLVLFPWYLLMALCVRTPGLFFRALCIVVSMRFLRNRDWRRAYTLLVTPLDSVRYFEFDFMWSAIRQKEGKVNYLDVSSPRLLPLMLIVNQGYSHVNMLNPSTKDLQESILFAKSLGVADQCSFYGDLIEGAHFTEETFDLITSMSVIEHILDDASAIQTMWSWLKPGGILLLSMPCAANAWEEYTNIDEYELIPTDERGFVFWQRYYDADLIKANITSIIGVPRRFQIYAEKKKGYYERNVFQKRCDPYYPFWREPFMTGMQYGFKDALDKLPGIGVIAMEFVKSK